MRRMSSRCESRTSAPDRQAESQASNWTPIFSQIWLVGTQVLARLRLPASLRSACDIGRACSRPGYPPDPQLDRGVSAATESIATGSTARKQGVDDLEEPLAVVGLERSSSSCATPIRFA